jgi:hypothetical protein
VNGFSSKERLMTANASSKSDGSVPAEKVNFGLDLPVITKPSAFDGYSLTGMVSTPSRTAATRFRLAQFLSLNNGLLIG